MVAWRTKIHSAKKLNIQHFKIEISLCFGLAWRQIFWIFSNKSRWGALFSRLRGEPLFSRLLQKKWKESKSCQVASAGTIQSERVLAPAATGGTVAMFDALRGWQALPSTQILTGRLFEQRARHRPCWQLRDRINAGTLRFCWFSKACKQLFQAGFSINPRLAPSFPLSLGLLLLISPLLSCRSWQCNLNKEKLLSFIVLSEENAVYDCDNKKTKGMKTLFRWSRYRPSLLIPAQQ